MRDPGLSHAAKVLYDLLDDMAGEKGECWPKQQTLSVAMQLKPRQIRSLIEELGQRVTRERGRYNTRYGLEWASGKPVQTEIQTGKKLPVRAAINCQSWVPTPLYEPGKALNQQQQPHLTREFTEAEKTSWMQMCLREYPGAAVALGSLPTEANARACMELVDWNPALAREILEWLFKRRRAVPQTSWQWFVSMFRIYLQEVRQAG